MSIAVSDLRSIIADLGDIASDDIMWSETIRPPETPEDFALEAIFVICNSGMKNTVARRIFDRVVALVQAGRPAREGFGHVGKVEAIETIWRDRASLHKRFLTETTDEGRLSMLASLPWIGDITKYHLAKNFGVDVAKPDVHLQRLADREDTTPQALCERLARESGYRIATVDLLLWRACATGLIDSRTGQRHPPAPAPISQADLFAPGETP